MTKKDYQAIARAIHAAREDHANRMQWESEVKETVADLTARLADVFAADNPRFDRARFIEACETGRCKGMPRSGAWRGEDRRQVKPLAGDLPLCVQAMGCLCAGHARGNPATEGCCTSERDDGCPACAANDEDPSSWDG